MEWLTDRDVAARLSGPRPLLLDGGLATTLEELGHVLDDALWSARLLRDAPDEIAEVHRRFLDAGADIVTSASYQASRAGFIRAGMGSAEADRLIAGSVPLARGAVEAFRLDTDGPDEPDEADEPDERDGRDAPDEAEGAREVAGSPVGRRLTPMVAASVGPWGAVQADGSEYTGRYAIDRDALIDFHGPRYEVLASAGPDLMACETIPMEAEVEALLEVIDRFDVPAYLSFCCRDGAHLSDGTPVERVAALCEEHARVLAVGVNCTAPRHVPDLVRGIATVSTRTVVAYPNAGGRYDADRKVWEAGVGDTTPWIVEALQAGAGIVGGCCRVGPERIGELRRLLDAGDWSA